ncbi:hypothetical protein LCM00_20170 [Bacillus infantis]|uniref:hypothetical protein n=1 Tax=Bacillus infantis TaxID=324767 RepID=UPI001CD33BF1|nr:hypothetical protein [Bacillus infantis]MCA1041817.1 hypothetical protein [Bacillus infantis]
MEIEIDNYNIIKADGFKGFEINFEVEDQAFLFILGDNSEPFTIGVKHHFRVKAICTRCGKVIYPSLFGQQLCTYFSYNKQQELMDYFAPSLPK